MYALRALPVQILSRPQPEDHSPLTLGHPPTRCTEGESPRGHSSLA